MFTSDIKGVTGVKQSFYGNDDSCLFKFFVLWSEPQAAFVWGVGLGIHCICFVIVVISHLLIGILSSYKSDVPVAGAAGWRRELRAKISAIIISDLCCWVPFLVCCVLHTAEVVDMSPWYSTFSIVILPLNSVLNPILYTDHIFNKLIVLFNIGKKHFDAWKNVLLGMFDSETRDLRKGRTVDVQDPETGEVCEVQDSGSGELCEVQYPGSGEICEVQDLGSGETCEVQDLGSGETFEVQEPGSG
eukprot:sb/3468927/